MTAWEGFASDVLEAVRARLDARKADLGPGVAMVRLGRQYRGWATPAIFVRLDPAGSSVAATSGRHLLQDYAVDVQVIALVKDMAASRDDVVASILEDALDVLDAVMPLGGSRYHEVPFPVRIGEDLQEEDGSYTTTGAAVLRFHRSVSRDSA